MIRTHMIRRLLYLRNWEFLNIFLLPLCLYLSLTVTHVENWHPYLFGMLVLCVILLQGTLYWHLKLQAVRKNKMTLPPWFNRTFTGFKWGNIALLSMYLILMICNEAISALPFQVSFWSNALFLFVLLEYINYYHYQLSHDSWNDILYLLKHRRIRRSPLFMDLQRNQALTCSGMRD